MSRNGLKARNPFYITYAITVQLYAGKRAKV